MILYDLKWSGTGIGDVINAWTVAAIVSSKNLGLSLYSQMSATIHHRTTWKHNECANVFHAFSNCAEVNQTVCSTLFCTWTKVFANNYKSNYAINRSIILWWLVEISQMKTNNTHQKCHSQNVFPNAVFIYFAEFSTLTLDDMKCEWRLITKDVHPNPSNMSGQWNLLKSYCHVTSAGLRYCY